MAQVNGLPPDTNLPNLKAWHDIAFLQYQEHARERNQPVRNLRYIFSAPVHNSISKAIINRAIGANLPTDCARYEWDNRVELPPEHDGFNALLASPNGRGAPLMLITHKSVFGQRRIIESVTVFCSPFIGGLDVNLLFTIRQREEDDDDDD
ncbi:hypothetical protein P280DRAFT_466302 [Massarina eburnea CBS 473.64]|uniref:Uncharacterized protein n=1 Tax=Massarina eburnea CBS 473.64 TaxID=1395130 RepID=A0A6A6SE00_9PLEO|nr:hypothetical protein P280DRAFT_466302 [Massarina eburnea CBS 473.64]